MYGPLPMHLLNGVVWVYERVEAPAGADRLRGPGHLHGDGARDLRRHGNGDGPRRLLHRQARLRTPIGGLLAAALLATTVVHIAESHSFRVDLDDDVLRDARVAVRACGSPSTGAGATISGPARSRAPPSDPSTPPRSSSASIGVAHLVDAAPSADRGATCAAGSRGPLRGLSPLVLCALAFAIINPMAFLYYRQVPAGRPRADRQPADRRVEADLDGAVHRRPAAAVLVHDEPVVGLGSGAGGVGPARHRLAALATDAADARRRRLSADLLPDRRRHRSRRWRATRCRWRRRSPWRPERSARSCSSAGALADGSDGRHRRRGRPRRRSTRSPT